MRRTVILALAAVLTIALGASARAQVPDVRFAQQTSMGYLQFNVMKHQDLLAKHAAAAGIPEVKVSWVTFNGPDSVNEALLAGAIDIASGGVPGMLTIWAKTRGTAQEVRAVSGMAHQTLLLNSRDPSIHSVRDFKPGDRIALPAVKVSAQAVLLQMAAAKEWGEAAFDRLDTLTFSLPPPDATAGLLSGHGDFQSAFTVPPFQNMQLKDPAIHTVLSSEQVIGEATSSVAWTTKRFHDANPKLYQAVLDALQEASAFIAAHPRETAEYYIADTRAKIDPDMMVGLITDPHYRYVMLPRGTLQWATFMFKQGRIKSEPASWKDMFWPEIHGMDGS